MIDERIHIFNTVLLNLLGAVSIQQLLYLAEKYLMQPHDQKIISNIKCFCYDFLHFIIFINFFFLNINIHVKLCNNDRTDDPNFLVSGKIIF